MKCGEGGLEAGVFWYAKINQNISYLWKAKLNNFIFYLKFINISFKKMFEIHKLKKKLLFMKEKTELN